ncbi:hypothetical protein MPSI1_003310 [Malassezia psittaci]|uniref:Uncharacterized protein n=1 Tax=Malassezia psittaci TaxID=1821823 RepID=A0AAF0JFF8_9BASI|nr:hypothetical protein MPSI1_003310 [Malassezia psittaci]
MAASTESRGANTATPRSTDTHRPDARSADTRNNLEPQSANSTTYDGCDAAVPNATAPFLTNVENHWGRVTLTAPDNMRRRRGREKRVAAQSRPPRLLVSQPGRASTSDLRRLAQEARLSTRAAQFSDTPAQSRSRRNSSNANPSQSAGTHTVLLQSSRATPASQTQFTNPVTSSSSSSRRTNISAEDSDSQLPRSWDRRRNVWDEVPETLQLAEMDWVDPPPSFAHACTDPSPAPSSQPLPPAPSSEPLPIPAPPLAPNEPTSTSYNEPQSPPPPFVSDDDEAGPSATQIGMEQTGTSSSLRMSSPRSSLRNSDSESVDDQPSSESPVDFRNLQQQMAWESDRLAGYTLEERVRRMQQRLLNASDAWTYRRNTASQSERHFVQRSEHGQDAVAPPIRAPDRLPQLAPGRPRARNSRLNENRLSDSLTESMPSEQQSSEQQSSTSLSLATRQSVAKPTSSTSRSTPFDYTPRSPSSILHQVRAPARIANVGSQSDHESDSSQLESHHDSPSSDSEQEWQREHAALQALQQYERDMRKAVRRSRKQSFNTQQVPMPSEMNQAQSRLLQAFSVLDREMPRAPPSQLSTNDTQRDSDNLYDLSSDSESLWADSSEDQSRDSHRFETLDVEPASQPSPKSPRNKRLNDAASSERDRSFDALSGQQVNHASFPRMRPLNDASTSAEGLDAPLNKQTLSQDDVLPPSDQDLSQAQSVKTPPASHNPFRDTNEMQSISPENQQHAQAIATQAFAPQAFAYGSKSAHGAELAYSSGSARGAELAHGSNSAHGLKSARDSELAYGSEQADIATRLEQIENIKRVQQISLHSDAMPSSPSASDTERNLQRDDATMNANQRQEPSNSDTQIGSSISPFAKLPASSLFSASTPQRASARPLPPLPPASVPRRENRSTPSRTPLMPGSQVPASPSTYQRESLARSNSTFSNWRSSTAPKPARSHLPKVTPATRHFQPTKTYVHDDTSSSTTSRTSYSGGVDQSMASPTASIPCEHAQEPRILQAEEPRCRAPPLPLRQNSSASNVEHDLRVERRRPAPPPPVHRTQHAPFEQGRITTRTQRTEAAPAIQGSMGALAYTAPTIRAVPLTGSRSSESQGETVHRRLRTPMDLVAPSQIRHGEDFYTEPNSARASAGSELVDGALTHTLNPSNENVPGNPAENPTGDRASSDEQQNDVDRQDTLAGMTDLDLVLLSLEDPTLQYEGATLLGDYLGPAPSTALSVDEIQTIPVGIVESEPCSEARNSNQRSSLSVVGVRVDECAICLQAFKKGQWACILPCVHMYVRELLIN